MPNAYRIPAAALAACLLLICPDSLEPQASKEPLLSSHVRRIESLDSTDYADLQFMKPLLEGARIVQLGENGHGAAESMRLRSRLVRFLHAEMGFNVLAFESSLFLCYLGDEAAAASEPTRTLTRSLIGVWHTREMLPLFTYMRDTRAGDTPLRLAGFDVQPIGSARKERPAFFERVVAAVDSDYARTASELDRRFNREYDKGSALRRAYFRAHADELTDGYERLAQFVEANKAALQQRLERQAPIVARQEARSMSAYIRQQAATDMKHYAELRDRAMADNLAVIVEELFPGEKVIVWGHNYHLRHDNVAIPPQPDIFPGVQARSMGTWVRQRYGERVYTIGQYEVEGQAVDNSRQAYVIGFPADGLLERRLRTSGSPAAFLDLRAAVRRPDGDWLREAIPARYNGQHAESIVPADQFDGILMITKVNPPTFLY